MEPPLRLFSHREVPRDGTGRFLRLRFLDGRRYVEAVPRRGEAAHFELRDLSLCLLLLHREWRGRGGGWSWLGFLLGRALSFVPSVCLGLGSGLAAACRCVRMSRALGILLARRGVWNSVVLVFCGLGEWLSRWVCRVVEGERGRFSFISLYDI